jgi:predicted DNA-binding helix-hairpin-helix protein
MARPACKSRGCASVGSMATETTLARLAEAARFDLSCACGGTQRTRGRLGDWVYPAALPGGGTIPVLKAAQSSACERNCSYCALRAGMDSRQETMSPEAMARSFEEARRAGLVQGLFLTSAISGGPVATMDRLIATAEVLRRRHGFRGYLHLKIIPGCERSQVERAMQIATRVSVNLEVPSAEHLSRICPRKDFESGIMQPVRWIAGMLERREGNARSHTTQFVVGATGETDREIVERAHDLYARFRLARAYYSKFSPVPGTPLESRTPAPFIREHRLYQADFLMRRYGFAADEIPFGPDGNLGHERDPKEAWAALHPDLFPIEVNTASREELLRVPGLGPTGVERILARRREHRLLGAGDLGMPAHLAGKAAPHLLFDGARDAAQLDLPFGTRERPHAL